MTAPPSSSTPGSGQPRTAAWWFARWHSGELGRADRREYEAWRKAHPEEAHEFDQMQQLGHTAERLSRGQVEALLGGPVPARPRRTGWGQSRRAALGWACAALVLLAAGSAWWSLPAATPSYSALIAAERGERRRVSLPDGSQLDINGATRAELRFYDKRREINLASGEILFSVASDTARPFIVKAGSSDIRVTGTVFDVRRNADEVSVAVESGTVEVTGGHWWNMGKATLRAGQGIRVPADGTIGVPAPTDVATLTAWRDGRLVFRNAPLGAVLSEMNRYLATPLRLADERAGKLRVSASFDLDRPEAFLDALPAIAPVRLAPAPDGSVDISLR
ncbi:iron dicitrate transport regulator FecR [Achromobacter sp. RTa]|uniref:FecR family protein n=1 Tax=Achromobacter sp. RTa TaxID=1532557 RepID=UPI00050FB06A|nr:FecR domain-containing protein [Achromobacter sp. RTa]KGD99806.1 iron dicitrate transport regulator FecR [Achromobacter sp. RTa]